MSKKILVTETALRDAHQSLIATRMTTEEMIPILEEMDKIGWDAWLEPMSNTVYFKAPSRAVAEKFDLAPDWDDRLGGALAHIVVMQHVTKELLDILLAELSK